MLPFPKPGLNKRLREDDVIEIVGGILNVQNKSGTLGRVLKLPKARVEAIIQQYNDPQDRLFYIIDEFVKQVQPIPTWRVIVEALKHPLIGQPLLAQEIERKFCSLPLAEAGML